METELKIFFIEVIYYGMCFAALDNITYLIDSNIDCKEDFMIERISFSDLNLLQQMQITRQSTRINTEDVVSNTTGEEGASVEISPIINMINSMDQIDENLISFLGDNGDGALVPKDVKVLGKNFEKIDENKDGLLDSDEIKTAGDIPQSDQRTQKKGSKDKGSTTEEVTAQFDSDGDSVIDTEEVTTYGADGSIESVDTRPAG